MCLGRDRDFTLEKRETERGEKDENYLCLYDSIGQREKRMIKISTEGQEDKLKKRYKGLIYNLLTPPLHTHTHTHTLTQEGDNIEH